MKLIVTATKEVIGLFVEDGTLALLLVAWIGVAGLLLYRLPIGSSWNALILLAGCVCILVENVIRISRQR